MYMLPIFHKLTKYVVRSRIKHDSETQIKLTINIYRVEINTVSYLVLRPRGYLTTSIYTTTRPATTLL